MFGHEIAGPKDTSHSFSVTLEPRSFNTFVI